MNCIVSIVDFGAKADGNLQTENIQRAIDHCFLQGGGEVQIPTGEFHTGGVRLRSNVILHLLENAVLKGSRDPEDYFGYRSDSIEPIPAVMLPDTSSESKGKRNYIAKRTPGCRWQNALIRAINAENIAITGEKGSILDGNNCYDEQGEEGYRGPHCIEMYNCSNVKLTGYTVKDSANWAHAIFYSNNITVDNITILAGHDGIDVAACNNVIIENSRFYTGDDCVAGYANLNVWVHDCEMNSACSAFRFGGTNVFIEKCHIYGPCRYSFRGSLTKEEKICGAPSSLSGHRNNMLSAFTYYAEHSLPIEHEPGNIVISDCIIENADRLLHYNYSGNETWQKSRPLSDIRFENTRATGISMPLTAYGDEKDLFTLELKNVEISFRDGADDVTFMHACNIERIVLDDVVISNNNSNPLIKTWSDGKIEINNLVCNVKEENYIQRTEEPFNCMPI